MRRKITWLLARPSSGSATASGAPPTATLSTYVFQGNKGPLVLTVSRASAATNWQASLEETLVRSFTLEALPVD